MNMKFTLMPIRNAQDVLCALYDKQSYQSIEEHFINNMNPNLLVYADASYKAKLEWDIPDIPSDIQFFVNGEIIKYSAEYSDENCLIVNFKSDSYKFGNIFRDCYGYVQIEVMCISPQGDAISYFTDYLGVMLRSSKANESLQNMAEYVYKNHQKYMRKRDTLPSGNVDLTESREKSLDSQLELIKEVIAVYEYHLPFFKTNPHTLIEQAYSFDSFEKLSVVSLPTVRFIAQHPDELGISSDDTGIMYGKNKYSPRKTLILNSEQCRDCYENRIVLSFLRFVISFVEDLIVKISGYILNGNKSPFYKSGYILSTILILQATTHNLELKQKSLLEYKSKLQQLYFSYKAFLPVDEQPIFSPPKLTPVFRTSVPYRILYKTITHWFSFGSYDFSSENFLLPVLLNHRLYEYYVLFKLAELFEDAGFRYYSKESDCFPYPANPRFYSSLDHYNTFLFENENDERIFYISNPLYGDINIPIL